MSLSLPPEVVIYSTRVCSYCERARNLFARKQVAYREIKIDEDPAALKTMLERSGGRTRCFIGLEPTGLSRFDSIHHY